MELNINNISIEIANKKIVNDVSLKVLSGQKVAIIGPNGCGKSTLLKAIYKVINPLQGTITLDNLDIINTNEKEIAKNIAVVGQFNDLSFDFNVYDMVIMGRSPHKKFMESDSKKDHELTIEALKKVDMLEKKDRSYLTLSGGEKQRVVLARAIVQNPKLLILDEPTNHLDIKYQLQVLNIVKDINVTTLAVLHDLHLAAKYCDYIYIMKDGKIVDHGYPKEVLTKDNINKTYEVNSEIYHCPITNELKIAFID